MALTQSTTETLNIRDIRSEAAAEIRAQARARGIRIGEYVGRLVALHVAIRDCESSEGVNLADFGLGPLVH